MLFFIINTKLDKIQRRKWNLHQRSWGGVRSSLKTDFSCMIDDGPHPGPLPSDGRGNGHRQSWVDGWLSVQCIRRFFGEADDGSPSPLSAVGPAKADGGGGRGVVEP